MQTTPQLIERAEEFAREHPDQHDFVRKFVTLLRKIEQNFSGSARDTLVDEARRTFEQQTKIVRNTRRALLALERLQAQQRQVIEALSKLSVTRPPNATLH